MKRATKAPRTTLLRRPDGGPLTLRICLDANCLVRGFARQSGPSGRILFEVFNESADLRCVTSLAIRADWSRAAHSKSVQRYLVARGLSPDTYLALIDDLWRVCEVLKPEGEPPPCRDEKDRCYLHCAEFGMVDFIVSTDRDIAAAGGKIPVIGPAALVAMAFGR